MKLKIVFFFLFLLICSNGYAQSDLKGVVIDSHTREGIPGVNISLSNEIFTTTNSDGGFYVHNIKEQTYQIIASHISYKTRQLILEPGTREINISLDLTDIKLDEVIVTSSRHEQYLKNLPYSALMTGSGEIESKLYAGVPDVLKNEPGIALVRDGVWATDISIRGLSRSNIVTLVDGIRIETSNDLAARLSMIDLNDLERIEIIKGASSSLYGSGATGGVVNIVSRPVEFSDRFFMNGNLSAGYNSVNNSRIFSASASGGSSVWTSKISASLRNAGNTRTPAGVLPNSSFSDYSLAGLFNLMPAQNNVLRLNYQLFKAKDVGVPGGYPLFPDKARVTYPNTERELISAGYEIRNLSSLISKISLKYSYQYILREVENIPFQVQEIAAGGGQPARRVHVLKITPEADHYTNSYQFQTDFILSDRNFLLAGVDYWIRRYQGSREKFQHIEVLGSDGTTVVKTMDKILSEKPLPNSSYRSLGFFIQDEHQVVPDRIKITTGVRIDQINIKGEKTLNPLFEITNGVINYSPSGQKVIWNEEKSEEFSYSGNIGLLYSWFRNSDLTLNSGYSFRSPSLEERFQYIDLGSLIRIGNPDLKSERGYFFDLGFRYRSGTVNASASYFMNFLNDLVVEEPGSYDGRKALIKTNIGKARLYGFDLSVDHTILSFITAYGIVSYVRGEDLKENSDLPQIPPLNGTAGLKYRMTDNLQLEFSSTFFTDQNRTAPGEIQTPGYAFFNAMVSYQPAKIYSGKVQLFAGVENLFDRNYRNHLSTNRGSITAEPGRNIYIKTVINL